MRTGARLRALAAHGAKATVVLEADTFPDTATDTVVALLPGASNDEAIILNTHTDGPNATEENGALGLVALAKLTLEDLAGRSASDAGVPDDHRPFCRTVGAVDSRIHPEAPRPDQEDRQPR